MASTGLASLACRAGIEGTTDPGGQSECRSSSDSIDRPRKGSRPVIIS